MSTVKIGRRWKSPATRLLASALLLLTAGACGRQPEAAEIRFGVIAPLSGPLAELLGRPARQGALLAAQDLNERGGIMLDGRLHWVGLRLEDSMDRPETALDVARKLIHREGVIALVGPVLSRNAIAAAAVAEKQRVPMISPSATVDELTVGRRYVFRATLVDAFQGRVLARFARRDLEARSAAVLYDVASAYNRSVAEVFRRVFEDAGGQVVAFESYTTGERDFRAPLARIHEAQPDVLLLPNYLDDVPLQVRQARRMGLTAHFLGADAWDGNDFAGQPEFEGSYFIDQWHPEIAARVGEESRAFVAAYRRAYGETPNSVAALFYDSLGLLFTVIERAGSKDGDAIRRGLASVESFRGATGTLSFRGVGDPVKSAFLFKVSRGKVTFHDRIEPKGER